MKLHIFHRKMGKLRKTKISEKTKSARGTVSGAALTPKWMRADVGVDAVADPFTRFVE
jgi:hypothetical protein